MKKLLVSTCAALFLLYGCSDAHSSMTTNDEVFKVGNTSVNTNDIYAVLLPGTGSSTAVNVLQTKLLAELFPINEEIEKAADEFVNETKKNVGDTFEEQLKNAGFNDIEDYKAKVAIPNAQNKELTKLYVNDHFEDLSATFFPSKAQVLQFSSEQEAKEAHEKIMSGADIVSVGEDLGTSSTYSGKEEVYVKGSGLPDEALKTLVGVEAGLQDVISAASAEGAVAYYVVNVVSSDPTSFQEEAVELISGNNEVSTDASSYYFREHKFKIYDKTIYDYIKASLPALLEEPAKTKK